MIDFMFALSTLTNQAEVLKNTQKSALNSQLEEEFSSGSIEIGKLCHSRLCGIKSGFKIMTKM